MDWFGLLKKLEERQAERRKELKGKTKALRDTWKSLKLYEKIMIIGMLVMGTGLVIKGCLTLCAFARL